MPKYHIILLLKVSWPNEKAFEAAFMLLHIDVKII